MLIDIAKNPLRIFSGLNCKRKEHQRFAEKRELLKKKCMSIGRPLSARHPACPLVRQSVPISPSCERNGIMVITLHERE